MLFIMHPTCGCSGNKKNLLIKSIWKGNTMLYTSLNWIGCMHLTAIQDAAPAPQVQSGGNPGLRAAIYAPLLGGVCPRCTPAPCGPGAAAGPRLQAVARKNESRFIRSCCISQCVEEKKTCMYVEDLQYTSYSTYYIFCSWCMYVAWQYAICVARQRSYLLREANASYVL